MAGTLPDAVVFDLDGTLTDTEELWDEVRRSLADEDGVPWPPDATTAMMGMSTPEWGAYLSDVVGLRSGAEESARRTIAAMARRYRAHLPLLPGAVEAVRRVGALLPLGLATSSPRLLIDTVLDILGLTDAFAATVSTEEVAAGKPEPDGYLRACDLLRVDPARAVAVEDSTNGVRAALAAGMRVVVVPPAFHPPANDVLARADAVITHLDDLTPELLASLDRH